MTISNGTTNGTSSHAKFPARTHAAKLIKELTGLLPEAERSGVSFTFIATEQDLKTSRACADT